MQWDLLGKPTRHIHVEASPAGNRKCPAAEAYMCGHSVAQVLMTHGRSRLTLLFAVFLTKKGGAAMWSASGTESALRWLLHNRGVHYVPLKAPGTDV
eukprot:scaffold68935_cov18-Tisochrysis_lutea.AAC.1